MTDSTIARRYAQAFFLIGEEKSKTDLFLDQLLEVKELFAKTPELASVMGSKLVAGEKKKALVSQLLGEDTDADVRNFLCLIVDKDREYAICDIISEFQALCDEKNNIVEVKVQSACELSEEQLKALAASVKARTGKDARFSVELDESLIGGVKIIIGDLIYDASVTGQLAALKEQLLR